MLKFLSRHYYSSFVYTDEPKLFYKTYKWVLGLDVLISFRIILYIFLVNTIGIVCAWIIKPIILSILIILIGPSLVLLDHKELKKQLRYNATGINTPFQVRSKRIESFIRKVVTLNGKALGRKEWKTIQEYDYSLYNELLCNDCNNLCYFYSLAIARIIKDCTLIWGAIQDPLDSSNYYFAHAIVYRNGYIYDSNLRQSENYDDFVKLYKFKPYKQWNYDEYSIKNFRSNQREAFRKWCQDNNVLVYEMF